jgi:hypothetical protein
MATHVVLDVVKKNEQEVIVTQNLNEVVPVEKSKKKCLNEIVPPKVKKPESKNLNERPGDKK